MTLSACGSEPDTTPGGGPPRASAAVPQVPTGLTATARSATSIELSWTSASSNPSGFKLERSTKPDSGFTEIASATGKSYLNTGLAAGTTYYYRVRAYNAAGASGYSHIVEATTNDQTVRFFATDDNTTIQSNVKPEKNDTVFNAGALVVGCQWSYVRSHYEYQYSNCYRAALHFDLSALAGRDITQAVLQLTPSQLAAVADTQYEVGALASAWSTTTLTLNNQPPNYVHGVTAVDSPRTGAPLSWDVTPIVSKWAAGAWANNGLLIQDVQFQFPSATVWRQTEFYSTDFFRTDDDRPQLLVQYR